MKRLILSIIIAVAVLLPSVPQEASAAACSGSARITRTWYGYYASGYAWNCTGGTHTASLCIYKGITALSCDSTTFVAASRAMQTSINGCRIGTFNARLIVDGSQAASSGYIQQVVCP